MAFFAINVFAIAQDVKIKGVPVVNKHETFVREIQKKGFTKIEDGEKTTQLSGLFLGNKSIMAVWKIGDELLQVAIVFEENTSWQELKTKCDYLADLYNKARERNISQFTVKK